MSKSAPIVAGIDRPETPDETAARKAESSRIYRSSQTARHLIAALIATIAVVVVIVLIVPRGEPSERPEIDVQSIAADVTRTTEHPVVVPDVAEGWIVNAAGLDNKAIGVWNVTLAPSAHDARGFVRVAQAFNADAAWAPQVLGGIAPSDSTTIDGRSWDVYTIADPERTANVSYAIGTQAGTDYVLLYGALSPDATAKLAASLEPQIQSISEQP